MQTPSDMTSRRALIPTLSVGGLSLLLAVALTLHTASIAVASPLSRSQAVHQVWSTAAQQLARLGAVQGHARVVTPTWPSPACDARVASASNLRTPSCAGARDATPRGQGPLLPEQLDLPPPARA